ncbi:MAG: NAD(P)-dependent oxidoreductase [Solirubrobacteraceae bacterium]
MTRQTDFSARSIGVIGVGRMGLPMCARLVDAGFSVIATDRRADVRPQLCEVGGRWADSVSEVTQEVDTVITVLPGLSEVLEIVEPLVAALPANSAWIDMTSASPAVSDQARAAAGAKGLHLLDAPVGGNPETAREGRLLAYVGGAAEDLAQQRKLLGSLTDRILHFGPSGSGYVAKLLVNLLWFGQAVAGAEVLALADRSGLDPETVRSAIGDGASANRFMDREAPLLLRGEDLTSFSIARCLEEIEAALGIADELAVPMPVAERVAEIYRDTVARFGDADGELLAARAVAEGAGFQGGTLD